jgi:aryl-alcohol dehydrogenase-like predicted oxidoreductase
MRYGSISGVARPVSRLILGTMVFHTERQALTDELLDAFVEAGGTAIDLANVYGGGKSELAFGDWLRRRGQRDRLVVIAKGAHHAMPGYVPRMTPEAITGDLDLALERTGAGAADLYVLHKDVEEVPVGTIVDALDGCVRAGKAAVVGGSSWTTRRLGMANSYAAVHGKAPFAVSSPNHSLAVPNEPMWAGCTYLPGDAEALAWYAETQIPVLAWSSQARGFFSGRYSPGAGPDPDVLRVYDSPANWRRLERTRQLGQELGCTHTQIALAWVLAQPFPVYALIGPHSRAELTDCLGALELHLTPRQVAWLNLEDDDLPSDGAPSGGAGAAEEPVDAEKAAEAVASRALGAGAEAPPSG